MLVGRAAGYRMPPRRESFCKAGRFWHIPADFTGENP
jgi:hypothetical protein